VISLVREPTTMKRATNNEQPTFSAAAPPRNLLPYAWPLFTAVWLLFPAGFVVQVLRTGLPPVQLLAFLASLAAFVGVFLCLMLRYPFPAAELTPRELRIQIGLLLTLAALALYVELVYGSGVPYRFMYVVLAAAVTLPTRYAAWTIVAVTVAVIGIYATRSGWDAASWSNIIPFPLIGVGMIAVSRLVITVRELRTAREEIARLAVAEERLRFARDLHDLLGHSLSLITLKSELAGRLVSADPQRAATEVRDIEGVARRALREVREAVAGYRRPTLDEELAGARESLEAAGIACRIENEAEALPGATDAVLAWAVREGATNVVRHSNAKHCEIRVTRDGGEVRAEISDDGRDSTAGNHGNTAGSGLSGLSERVAASGGDFEAGWLPEGGFRLRVSLPSTPGGIREDERR
jgi:two-component system, NarL family, sensor histidine kinase DesK